MTFKASIDNCFKKYATFRGRASRSEFWWWMLFMCIVCGGLFMTAFICGYNRLTDKIFVAFLLISDLIFFLIIFIPTLAVLVRRYHDTDHSGWWLLCPIYYFVLLVTPGDPDENKYG